MNVEYGVNADLWTDEIPPASSDDLCVRNSRRVISEMCHPSLIIHKCMSGKGLCAILGTYCPIVIDDFMDEFIQNI